MKSGFVTFTTGGHYLELTEILIQSLLVFSKYPITIYALNTNIPFSYPNIDKIIRKDIDISNFHNICYEKLYASFNNDYDTGIMLDSDMIANKGIDILFSEINKNDKLPLGSLHPADPNNQYNIMDILNVKIKTIPYIHATYLFSSTSREFLAECYNFAKLCNEKNIIPANADETILNCMLWKYNATKFVKCYDPYFEYINNYITNNPINPHSNLYTLDRSFIFHGCKNTIVAREILNKLKVFHEN